MFEQDRVLVRLQQFVLRDEQILACFLAGSFGRGANDQYSDLDLILIFSDDESRNRAFEQRHKFIRSVLPYLSAKSFDAEHVKPYLHIALYGNGSKVDYLFETVDIEPLFHLREMRVLKEKGEWAENFLKECAAQQPMVEKATISNESLTDLDERFWIMFMDAYRRLLRGDHDAPFPIYLQMVCFTVPMLLRLLPTEDPAYQNLIDVYFSRDTGASLEHMRRLLKTYLAAREAVVKRHKLHFPVDVNFERNLLKKIEGA